MRRLLSLPALALAVFCLSPGPAAADGLFTVAGVHVDASSASVAQARNVAVTSGRPTAWQILFRRLTREQDWARQPVLADAQLQRLITTYYPANEKRSTRRYLADMTYVFNPEAVARLLQASGIAYTAAQARRVLMIPMAPTYSRGSPWTMALANPRFANSMVPFSVPIGDALDMNALGGLAFDTANWTDVEPVASRIRASEAVLIQPVVTGNKLTIVLRRLGAGELPTKASIQVPVLQGAASTYPAAADAAVHALEDMWKSHTAVDFSQKGKLVVDVQMSSLGQFASLQNMLLGVPNVSGVTVIAMDIGGARLSLSYMGSLDQLRDGLGQAGLGLTNRGGTWQLSQGAAANSSAP